MWEKLMRKFAVHDGSAEELVNRPRGSDKPGHVVACCRSEGSRNPLHLQCRFKIVICRKKVVFMKTKVENITRYSTRLRKTWIETAWELNKTCLAAHAHVTRLSWLTGSQTILFNPPANRKTFQNKSIWNVSKKLLSVYYNGHKLV